MPDDASEKYHSFKNQSITCFLEFSCMFTPRASLYIHIFFLRAIECVGHLEYVRRGFNLLNWPWHFLSSLKHVGFWICVFPAMCVAGRWWKNCYIMTTSLLICKEIERDCLFLIFLSVTDRPVTITTFAWRYIVQEIIVIQYLFFKKVRIHQQYQ